MITYIQKDCKEYVELELELDSEIYPIGSTIDDYEEGKWIKLSDEQLQFKSDNPAATKEEVIKMELTPEPEPELSEEDLLRKARRNKEKEIISKAQEYYVYNIDGTNIFTFDTLNLKDKCSRYNYVTVKEKEIDSNILKIALGEMSDYSERVVANVNSKISSIRSSKTVEDVEAIDATTGYPEIINTTTEELTIKLNSNNSKDASYQAVSFARMMVNTVSMSSNKALEMQVLFPIWGQEDAEFGKEVEVGFRLRVVKEDSDILYEVIQKHTLSKEWEPGLDTASLYKVIEIEHTGTQEDPIPYTPPMEIFKDKYYTQNDILYKCTRDSEIALSHDLSALVGTYVELA